MRIASLGAMLMTAALVAPLATAAGLPLAAPATVTKTFTFTEAPGDLFIYLDDEGNFGVRPVSEMSADALQECRHNSLNPGSAIAPLENSCTLSASNALGWSVGWTLPPPFNPSNQAGRYVGDTRLDFSGSNGGHILFQCSWSWLPPIDMTVSCALTNISGFPFGSVVADFDCLIDLGGGTEVPFGVGSWNAILFTFP